MTNRAIGTFHRQAPITPSSDRIAWNPRLLNRKRSGEAAKRARDGAMPNRQPPANHRRRAIRLAFSDFQNIHPTNTGASPATYERVSALKPNNSPLIAINHRGETGKRLTIAYAPNRSSPAREKVFATGNHAKTNVAEAKRTTAQSAAIHLRVS